MFLMNVHRRFWNTLCMLTTIGAWAAKHELNVEGTKINVSKEMSTDAPRRIAKLPITVTVPASSVSEDLRASLERVSHTCAVLKSLSPDLLVPVEFIYK